MNGKIYLIPSLLDDVTTETIPEYVKTISAEVDVYVVENLRSARRYLRKIGCKKQFDESNMFQFDKNSKASEVEKFIKLTKEGKDIGVISEAGCPCIADPGAKLVLAAHQNGIVVKPLSGPSSILMALMASGLSGQNFTFHGYLSVKKDQRRAQLKKLERKSAEEKQSQVFMETPYRNKNLLEDLSSYCQKTTLLSVGTNISGDAEKIITKPIGKWNKSEFESYHKQPSIFILQAF